MLTAPKVKKKFATLFEEKNTYLTYSSMDLFSGEQPAGMGV